MLPEADVTVFGFVPALDDCWGLADGLPGRSASWSVGVGGVTVVEGVSSDALGGVRGIVEILGISGFLTVLIFMSVSMDWGMVGRSSKILVEPLLLSAVPTGPPNVVPFSADITDARSGLVDGLPRFFRDPPVKTSLIFAPGDIPRPFREVSFSAWRASNVAAFRGARFVVEEVLLDMGNVADLGYSGG